MVCSCLIRTYINFLGLSTVSALSIFKGSDVFFLVFDTYIYRLPWCFQGQCRFRPWKEVTIHNQCASRQGCFVATRIRTKAKQTIFV